MAELGSTRFRIRKALRQREQFGKGVEEGRNQVLYILLAMGDDNVEHDNFNLWKANFLLETRRAIVRELELHDKTAHGHYTFPPDGKWPNFKTYTYCPG